MAVKEGNPIGQERQLQEVASLSQVDARLAELALSCQGSVSHIRPDALFAPRFQKSRKMTVAAMPMAKMKVWAQRS